MIKTTRKLKTEKKERDLATKSIIKCLIKGLNKINSRTWCLIGGTEL